MNDNSDQPKLKPLDPTKEHWQVKHLALMLDSLFLASAGMRNTDGSKKRDPSQPIDSSSYASMLDFVPMINKLTRVPHEMKNRMGLVSFLWETNGFYIELIFLPRDTKQDLIEFHLGLILKEGKSQNIDFAIANKIMIARLFRMPLFRQMGFFPAPDK